ncbi:MAG: hypothetical protein ACHQUC_05480 [Chlamydiales bacterium]
MEEQELDIIEENVQQTILEAKGLIPLVYEGTDAHPPAGFNALTIRLDGSLRSDLNWKAAKEQAEKAISKGYALFWDIDLGLFNRLTLPLMNQTQFLSLGLSLDHFRDTLWKDFGSHSLGLSIYRGNADFSLGFNWDEDHTNHFKSWLQEHFLEDKISRQKIDEMRPEDLAVSERGSLLTGLFCREVAVEYLSLLAARLPDGLPCYLFLNAASLAHDPFKQIQLLNPHRFDLFQLALKGATLPFKAWGWQAALFPAGYVGTTPMVLPIMQQARVGICLPLMNDYHPDHWQGLDHVLRVLTERSIPFRLISESHLITEWDGLDDLIYLPKGLSSQGKRKLQGFCAAGGRVISIGLPMGLPSELSFNAWV